MKTIILGNAGSGKTTLARSITEKAAATCLSLDDIAFGETAVRQSLSDSAAALSAFITKHENWVIEGCYADILTAVFGSNEKVATEQAAQLIFLNPGIETCIVHCKQRPWEPDKFADKQTQDKHLEGLLAWVKTYNTRDDEYGLSQHQKFYAGFTGNKLELTEPASYATELARLGIAT